MTTGHTYFARWTESHSNKEQPIQTLTRVKSIGDTHSLDLLTVRNKPGSQNRTQSRLGTEPRKGDRFF